MLSRKRPQRAKNVPKPRDAKAIARRMIWSGVLDPDDPQEVQAAESTLSAHPELFGLLAALGSDEDLIKEIKSRANQIQTLVQEQKVLM